MFNVSDPAGLMTAPVSQRYNLLSLVHRRIGNHHVQR